VGIHAQLPAAIDQLVNVVVVHLDGCLAVQDLVAVRDLVVQTGQYMGVIQTRVQLPLTVQVFLQVFLQRLYLFRSRLPHRAQLPR
jgi:hypothetical protein